MTTITAPSPSATAAPPASREGTPRRATFRTVLLACGIVSSVLYAAVNIVGALLYPGYSSASQTISELFAIGAPPRILVASLLVVYGLLVYAFGVGVWQSAGGKRALRLASVGIVGKEVSA